MKRMFTLFLTAACLNLPMAGYLRAGEVQKNPLHFEEMVVLAREEVNDYEETKDIEAGIANGYGLLTLVLVIGVGYLISEQLNDDDDKKRSSSGSSHSSTSTAAPTTTASPTTTSTTTASHQ